MLVIRAGIHKIFVRMGNMEDLDQTAFVKMDNYSFDYAKHMFWFRNKKIKF